MTDAPRSVAVVGGGYTGLVAALRLAEAGAHVTVYEASPTVGGLAADFTIEGTPLEKAYHHLFRTDTDIIALAGELGVGDALEWHESRQALYFDGEMHPFAGALDLLRFRPLSLVDRIRAGVVVLYLQRQRRGERYTRVTALAWMRRAAGPNVTRVIWEPLLQGKFHKHYDKVAMAWLWARVHIRANSKEKGELKEKLGYFGGGFETFTSALVARLGELGVDIRTSSPLEGIRADGDGPVLTVGGEESRADAVVATVPSGAFARLTAGAELPAGYRESLASIDYLGARLIVFSSDQDVSPAYWHNINDVDKPFLVFINHTQLVDASHYGGHHVYYLATYVPMDDPVFTCTDAELADSWFAALHEIFPDFDRGRLREVHHFRFANAQHIVDTGYRAKIPDHRTPLERVYLANFSQIFPEDRGTNFAVRDGAGIAAMVRADLGF